MRPCIPAHVQCVPVADLAAALSPLLGLQWPLALPSPVSAAFCQCRAGHAAAASAAGTVLPALQGSAAACPHALVGLPDEPCFRQTSHAVMAFATAHLSGGQINPGERPPTAWQAGQAGAWIGTAWVPACMVQGAAIRPFPQICLNLAAPPCRPMCSCHTGPRPGGRSGRAVTALPAAAASMCWACCASMWQRFQQPMPGARPSPGSPACAVAAATPPQVGALGPAQAVVNMLAQFVGGEPCLLQGGNAALL